MELKFPRNGQYPEQMFSFCKDIQFIEQLKQAGFRETYLLIFADDPLFYSGPAADGIYRYFRGGELLTGEIRQPTGLRQGAVRIAGRYDIRWVPARQNLKYALIEAAPEV